MSKELVIKNLLCTFLKSRPTPNFVLKMIIKLTLKNVFSNFVTKIAKYHKVVDVPNSMTVLTDMLPLSAAMSRARLCGIYNFCNPGAISHNQVLQIYKDEVDESFTWENFSLDEQAKIIAGLFPFFFFLFMLIYSFAILYVYYVFL